MYDCHVPNKNLHGGNGFISHRERNSFRSDRER